MLTIIIVLLFIIFYRVGYLRGYQYGEDELNFVHESFNELSQKTPCGNISKYYTGNGFGTDMYAIILDSHYCRNNITESEFSVYNVDWLDNCSKIHIDCEDVSHMLYCLAGLYNETCEYYTYFGVNTPHHRGIKCDFGYGFENIY